MSLVDVSYTGDVAVVRMQRPPANALDLALLEMGLEVADRLSSEAPAAVVLTGSGDFFSGGVDLKVVPTLDRDAQSRMVDGINKLFLAWYELPSPLVCAVNGHAVAGGLILALCGDWRIASRSGRYGLTEVAVGVPYPAAAIAIVEAELPAPAARRLVLGAELTDGEPLLAAGAFDELADQADVLPMAMERAQQLAALPARSYRLSKRQLRTRVSAVRHQLEAGDDPLKSAWTEDADTP